MQRQIGPVYAYLTFHVRTEALADFCQVAAVLIAGSARDTGRLRMDLHRELPWARQVSNDDFSLFLMCQEWATPADLEAHVASAHAMRFNEVVSRMLIVEPSATLFGAPLSPSELARLGAEATAAAEAEAAEARMRSRPMAAQSPSQTRTTAAGSTGSFAGTSGSLNSSGGLPPRLPGGSRDDAMRPSGSFSGSGHAAGAASPSRSGSRSTLLTQSGSAMLHK
mmetsp:Transcript_101448/g.293452  ORF Transcript_101448/g.293452 Transcript_101448/m.293452 type:complete len:223 (+) Transcript_101448:86-754(+)